MNIIGRRSVASFVTVLLDIAWWGMAVAIAVATFLAVLPLWFDVSTAENVSMDIPVAFSLDAAPLAATAPDLGIGDAEIRDVRAQGNLTFAPPDGAFLSVVAIGLIGAIGWLWWIVTELRAVLRTLRAGTPFVPANARRIRRIGYALLVGEMARLLVGVAYGSYLLRHVHADGVRFLTRPDVDIFAIVAALIILVISEVFRAGTRLDEETALTV